MRKMADVSHKHCALCFLPVYADGSTGLRDKVKDYSCFNEQINYKLIQRILFVVAENSECLMLVNRRQIVGIPFTSQPDDEGFGETFVSVVGLSPIIDFDYDSRKNLIYWIELSKRGGSVSHTRGDVDLTQIFVVLCRVSDSIYGIIFNRNFTKLSQICSSFICSS